MGVVWGGGIIRVLESVANIEGLFANGLDLGSAILLVCVVVQQVGDSSYHNKPNSSDYSRADYNEWLGSRLTRPMHWFTLNGQID